MRIRTVTAIAGMNLLSVAGLTSQAPQVDVARGCTIYQSGLTFMAEKKYEEALKVFATVLESCAQVNIQAQAQLQRGYIFLQQWPPQFAAARSAATAITGRYLNTPTAPDGFILLGQIELQEQRNFEGARNQFRLLRDISASSTSLAQAQYLTGETYRIAHQPREALRSYQDVTLKYPATVWKARALIGSASCYLRLGDPISAMEALQRVRRESQFRGTEEAALALKWNTILYRLTMRGRSQTAPAGTPLGPGRYRDAVGLTLDEGGRIILGYRDGIAVLSADNPQQFQPRGLGSVDIEAAAVGLGPGRVLALARDRFLVLDRGSNNVLEPKVPQRDGKLETVEIRSFVTNWNGEWLVADQRTDAIHRFSVTGAHVGVFASNVSARRMIRNDIDDVAVVNDRTKGITLYPRDGMSPREVPRRVQGSYEWDTPSDIAFDALANLYVLDGSKATIHIFDPELRFSTTIQLPLRKAYALAVDESGRIYVLDRDGQQVVVYQ